MNGQHLRALPFDKLTKLVGERWKSAGILTESEGSFVDVRFLIMSPHFLLIVMKRLGFKNNKYFLYRLTEFELVVEVQEAVELLKDGIDLVTDSDKVLLNLLSYPLHATLAR